ncbi:MAG: hypothetical protein RMY16_32445 [Nostoc sp. DedQUE12b]|uniref:hypothetical protein n=1 Tax=Nostoc sp. DedQUE12b TaxID=3075398 RepID=UPI002AD497F9|nr:hypothetical protein [Nostoc sp. DedQUE12b]MDZ8090225.1 hypothetical protein [Nostoc sp. DedQUE12b]
MNFYFYIININGDVIADIWWELGSSLAQVADQLQNFAEISTNFRSPLESGLFGCN